MIYPKSSLEYLPEELQKLPLYQELCSILDIILAKSRVGAESIKAMYDPSHELYDSGRVLEILGSTEILQYFPDIDTRTFGILYEPLLRGLKGTDKGLELTLRLLKIDDYQFIDDENSCSKELLVDISHTQGLDDGEPTEKINILSHVLGESTHMCNNGGVKYSLDSEAYVCLCTGSKIERYLSQERAIPDYQLGLYAYTQVASNTLFLNFEQAEKEPLITNEGVGLLGTTMLGGSPLFLNLNQVSENSKSDGDIGLLGTTMLGGYPMFMNFEEN
jgi:hypothetical protein